MEPTGFERKLIAILSADVQGYSRLMGADEDGTLRRLTDNRRALDAIIADNRGTIVSTAGDSILAEFSSPVAAVQSAIEMQRELAQGNTGVPAKSQMLWRIGINLGDVLVEANNIFGEGVNVAARLQEQAPAGGICISGSVYDQVSSGMALEYKFQGEKRLKNIARPVRVYTIGGPGHSFLAFLGKLRSKRWGTALPGRSGRRRRILLILAVILGLAVIGAWPEPGVRPVGTQGLSAAIAVLPFRPIGGGEREALLTEGLTEDLLVVLAEQTQLSVVSGSGQPGAGGAAPSARTVGLTLGVRYVLDGSVRSSDTQFRVTASLVDVRTGFNLWGTRFDRNILAVLALESDIAETIISGMSGSLAEAEQEYTVATTESPSSLADYVLRGLEKIGRLAREAVLLPSRFYSWLTGAEVTGS